MTTNLYGRNLFAVKTQTITQFNPIPAPGANETVIVNTMQPLEGTDQENKDIEIKSFLGTITVSIT